MTNITTNDSATTFTFNDGLMSGGRKPLLILVKEGQLIRFQGKSIAATAVVVNATFEKNGKWSNTTYTLAIARNVTARMIVKDLNERSWLLRWKSGAEGGEELGVDGDEGRRFFSSISGYAKGVQELDEREAMLASLS